MKRIKSIIIINSILIFFCGSLYAGSIILPFWQDDGTPIYTMFVILNTSPETGDYVRVQFYGKTGNPQSWDWINFEKTIPPKNLEIFGTPYYQDEIPLIILSGWGFAIAYETDGMMLGVGIVYDCSAHAGYPIPCFPGNDDGSAVNGW